jgi:hypothetical protein
MQQPEHGIENGGVEAFLVAEVVVNGGHVRVGAVAYFADCRSFEAVFGEHFDRRL